MDTIEQRDLQMLFNALNDAKNYIVTDVDNTTTANVTYVRYCKPGNSDAAAAVSCIKKIDTTSGVVITWSGGTKNFNQIWNNRATTVIYSRLT